MSLEHFANFAIAQRTQCCSDQDHFRSQLAVKVGHGSQLFVARITTWVDQSHRLRTCEGGQILVATASSHIRQSSISTTDHNA
jgi:hypothetical protein